MGEPAQARLEAHMLSTLRGACAVSVSSAQPQGHRKPRGKAPDGCFWDPRPREASGAWRRIDDNEIYDPKAHAKACRAAHRYAETTAAGRAARAAPTVHARDEGDERAVIEQRVETHVRDGSLCAEIAQRDETDASDGSPYAHTSALDSVNIQGRDRPRRGRGRGRRRVTQQRRHDRRRGRGSQR